MLLVWVLYLLSLGQEEQVHIILEDLDKDLHPHSVLSSQRLEEMVRTNPINTQEDLEVLELVEMLICTVAVEAVMEDIMEQEDIVSSVDVLPEVIPVVETIRETIKIVQHLGQVEQTDGLDPT